MSKTAFSNKCAILGELWLFYREDAKHDEAWSEFFRWTDVGLPLAYMIWQGIAGIKKGQENYINEPWNTFCAMIDIDPNANYSSLADCFFVSPNKPLEYGEG